MFWLNDIVSDIGYDIGYDIICNIVYDICTLYVLCFYLGILVPKSMSLNVKGIASRLWPSMK